MKRAPAVASRAKRQRTGTKKTPTRRIGIIAMEIAQRPREPMDGGHLARPAAASAWEADDIWSNGAEMPPPTTGMPPRESPALVRPFASWVADGVGLPADPGQLHRAVLDDVPDPHPADQPEHEQHVREQLTGTADGGVGVELHGAHPTSSPAEVECAYSGAAG